MRYQTAFASAARALSVTADDNSDIISDAAAFVPLKAARGVGIFDSEEGATAVVPPKSNRDCFFGLFDSVVLVSE